jgi:hypothetical protein
MKSFCLNCMESVTFESTEKTIVLESGNLLKFGSCPKCFGEIKRIFKKPDIWSTQVSFEE